jgi:lactate permease
MLGGLTLILAIMTAARAAPSLDPQMLRDLAPFALMLGALLLVNLVPILKEWTYHRAVLQVNVVPVHTISLRPLFSAYLYLGAPFVLSALLLRVPKVETRRVLKEGARRGWRASLAMGLFGAMGQVIAYSGYTADFSYMDQAHNIPWILAHGLEGYSGHLFPLFVPFLGWVGTFLTGYGVASLMLFGPLQVETARLLDIPATWLAASLAVGASLGSISSPFKIAIATPMCDAVGKEGEILRVTIPMGVAASLLVGLTMWIGLR